MSEQRKNGSQQSESTTLKGIQEQIEHDRLAELREARRYVREARDETQLAVMEGEATPLRANAAYLNALQSFLHLLRPYGDRDDLTRSYWVGTEDSKIGSVVASPPSTDADGWTSVDDSGSVSTTPLEPRAVDTWRGLSDVLTAQLTYKVTWVNRYMPENMAPQVRKITRPATPHRGLIDEAFSWTNDFCADVGLGLDVSVNDRDAEMEYHELL